MRQLPCFETGELKFTQFQDSEWHQIYLVENENVKAVVCQPSSTGLDSWRILEPCRCPSGCGVQEFLFLHLQVCFLFLFRARNFLFK